MAEGQILNKKVVKNYLRDKVAAYKIPRDYIQVDHLPKNQSGKIMKRSLREQHKR
jgi:long-chain acyl-CoA synthetase